jgi:hypothetical protein
MRKTAYIPTICAAASVLVLLLAHAQATRASVSGIGNDSNE